MSNFFSLMTDASNLFRSPEPSVALRHAREALANMIRDRAAMDPGSEDYLVLTLMINTMTRIITNLRARLVTGMEDSW